MSGAGATPEQLLLRDTLDADLRAALDALPEAFRQAVWLRDVEEFSYAEIAEMVGIPIGTVMSRISRGRRWLHDALRASCAGRGAAAGAGGERGTEVTPAGRLNGRYAELPDIEPLVTPYVDDGRTAADRSIVAAHLEGCRPVPRPGRCRARGPPCAAGPHAASLVGRAPLDLRARCAAALRAPAAAGLAAGGRTARLSMAAAVVPGRRRRRRVRRRSAALADAPRRQLTLDHLKCFAFFEASSGPADPVELEAKLQRAYGWRRRACRRRPRTASLQLVGARRCLTADGRIAHVLYRHDGRPLSLFVLPATERPSGHVEVFGYETRIWSHAGTTFVLVGGESPTRTWTGLPRTCGA